MRALRHKIELPARPVRGEVVCTAENINLERGGKQLLKNVSLELRAGEVLALLGPNGAGKSTLLSVLSGDSPADSGTVRFLGQEISAWKITELARLRSVLLQENHLTFPFTAQEVVEMGRAPWRRTQFELEDEEAVAQAMSAADVTHLATRRVPSLSGGERARVAFARVLASRTGVLMLDEPTAALDLAHQESVLSLARERAAAGDAVVVVLHDLNLAAAFADRIALLRQGELVSCAAVRDVIQAEIISAVYEIDVEVIPHPLNGSGIVLPRRER